MKTLFLIIGLSIGLNSFADEGKVQNYPEQITQATDPDAKQIDIPKFSTEDWKNLIIQVITFIFILALGSFALIKLQRGGKFMPFAKNSKFSKLHILETKSLGNRQYVIVVEYENSKFLLGVSQNNVKFLTNL